MFVHTHTHTQVEVDNWKEIKFTQTHVQIVTAQPSLYLYQKTTLAHNIIFLLTHFQICASSSPFI